MRNWLKGKFGGSEGSSEEENNHEETEKQMSSDEKLMDALLIDAFDVIRKSGVYPSNLILTPKDEPRYTSRSVFKAGVWPHETLQGDHQVIYGINTQNPENPNHPFISLDTGEALISFAPTFSNARAVSGDALAFYKNNPIHTIFNNNELVRFYALETTKVINPNEWKLDLSLSEIFIIYKNEKGQLLEYPKYLIPSTDKNSDSKFVFTRQMEETFLGDDGFLILGNSIALFPQEISAVKEIGNRHLTTYVMSPARPSGKLMPSDQPQRSRIRSLIPRPI